MKEKEKLRLVIDTNVWISYLIGKHTKQLEKILTNNSFRIFASHKLLNELFSILNRPKFKKLISKEIIDEFFELSENIFEIVVVNSKVNICRDPSDDFLLELCKECNADYLITGDKDILSLNNFNNTKIITFKDLLQKYYII